MCVLRRERGSLARRRFWTFPVVCACVVVLAKSVVLCVLVVWRGHICFARMHSALLVNCHGFRSMLSSQADTFDTLCTLERMRR